MPVPIGLTYLFQLIALGVIGYVLWIGEAFTTKTNWFVGAVIMVVAAGVARTIIKIPTKKS